MPTVMMDNGFSVRDREHMARALQLAANGLETTSPNPRVGCVIVRDDVVIGEGWHRRAGGAHAEIEALNAIDGDARGATVYVTLEPCCTTGRTGPCTEALIAAGVARVVSAVEDPNPAVAGSGHALLRKAGIEVACGLLAEGSQALNQGYWQRIAGQRPRIRIKLAASLDGRTAMASGESQWITAAPARAAVQRLRAQSCAVITGIGTVLADNPRLNVRGDQVERQPALVIVDAAASCRVGSWVMSEASIASRDVIVATLGGSDRERCAALQARGAQVLELPAAVDDPTRVDLSILVEALGAREYNELLVEAGSELAGSFVASQLCDELQLFVAGKFMGSRGKPLLALPIDVMADAVDMSIAEVRAVGKELMFVVQPKFS